MNFEDHTRAMAAALREQAVARNELENAKARYDEAETQVTTARVRWREWTDEQVERLRVEQVRLEEASR